MEYEFRGNTDFLKPYKGKNSEIIFQIDIVAPGAKANWLSMILLHDSVLTPLRISSLFIANQYHSKCVLSFQTKRCAEPDIHYVDKVIFIRWYFVGQTMVDNVCGDRKQVIAVNDPNSSLNYPFVHTNKMAVQLSHTYYDYQLLCMITDHWSVYWYYCCRYHYFGGNYSRVHTNKSVWQPNIYLLDLFQLSLLLAPSGALIAIPTYYWPSTPTFSDHTGPQHWTFTFWATTAISRAITGLICWLHVYLMVKTWHHCKIMQDGER